MRITSQPINFNVKNIPAINASKIKGNCQDVFFASSKKSGQELKLDNYNAYVQDIIQYFNETEEVSLGEIADIAKKYVPNLIVMETNEKFGDIRFVELNKRQTVLESSDSKPRVYSYDPVLKINLDFKDDIKKMQLMHELLFNLSKYIIEEDNPELSITKLYSKITQDCPNKENAVNKLNRLSDLLTNLEQRISASSHALIRQPKQNGEFERAEYFNDLYFDKENLAVDDKFLDKTMKKALVKIMLSQYPDVIFSCGIKTPLRLIDIGLRAESLAYEAIADSVEAYSQRFKDTEGFEKEMHVSSIIYENSKIHSYLNSRMLKVIEKFS